MPGTQDAAPPAVGAALRAGETVEVRSFDEIQATLDSHGALDGLPFMPEMLDFTGRRFRIGRRAGKTCVELRPQWIPIRAFRNNDVVVLEDLRCSGAGHDGCQRACLLFWKEAWLRKVNPGDPPPAPRPPTDPAARPPLKTRGEGNRYFCQSTELRQATEPLSQLRRLRLCVEDVRSCSRGPLEMVGLLVGPLWRKLTRRFRSTFPRGPLTQTPSSTLGLQAGDFVEVKRVDEIVATLDAKGRNRGLQYDLLLRPYCGQQYRVRHRLDRMIIESTGEMRELRNTVVLEGTTCRCAYVVGGCPRADPVYWREIWLKRMPPGDRE